jgi:endo-1,4-beta-D-glucanase Y
MTTTTTISSGAWWARWAGVFSPWARRPGGIATGIATISILILLQASPSPGQSGNADNHLIDELWRSYRQTYIRADGRVVDRRLDRVTSEGQSYGLLRAVWMGDADTFARVFAWTEAHLRRPDGLYAWLWQPVRKGQLTDTNTATDADQDIALALILAADAFRQPAYLERAAALVKAIRQQTGIPIGQGWFISAGNWARTDRIINLSYFSPAAYPYFQDLDPQGDWEALRGMGYRLVARTLAGHDTRLIPDFCRVTPQGVIHTLPDDGPLSNAFSFDAMRLYWRLALDCRLHGRRTDCGADLGFQALVTLFQRNGRLYQVYGVDGVPRSEQTSVSFYGALLPFMESRVPGMAARLRQGPLSAKNILNIANQVDRYYDLNWIWFGLALSSGWIVQNTPPP